MARLRYFEPGEFTTLSVGMTHEEKRKLRRLVTESTGKVELSPFVRRLLMAEYERKFCEGGKPEYVTIKS